MGILYRYSICFKQKIPHLCDKECRANGIVAKEKPAYLCIVNLRVLRIEIK